jgi:hypothetical protein
VLEWTRQAMRNDGGLAPSCKFYSIRDMARYSGLIHDSLCDRPWRTRTNVMSAALRQQRVCLRGDGADADFVLVLLAPVLFDEER